MGNIIFERMSGLEKIRLERKLSRKDIINMLKNDGYDLSVSAIYNYEKKFKLGKQSLERIAKVLDVSIEDIL